MPTGPDPGMTPHGGGVDPEEWYADPTDPFGSPLGTASTFLTALADPRRHLDLLRRCTTPESWPSWRDYTDVAAAMAEAGGWRLPLRPQRADGEPDVAWLAVLPADGAAVEDADGDVLVPEATAVLTLVRRPLWGGWLVHAMGAMYLEPDQVPRDRV